MLINLKTVRFFLFCYSSKYYELVEQYFKKMSEQVISELENAAAIIMVCLKIYVLVISITSQLYYF